MDDQMPEAVNDGSDEAEARLKASAEAQPEADDREPDPQVAGPHTPHRAVNEPDDRGKETDGNVPVANLE